MPKHIALDLGTSNTRMYVKGRGIVMRSPTVVTVEKQSGEIIATGREAKRMIGKTPANMTAHRPIRNGVLTDFDVASDMLHEFFCKSEALSLFNRPVVLVSIPENCTQVEALAFENVILSAGAKAVGTVSSAIAAAVGAGLKISSPRGCMLVDVGGGMTQISVISSGSVIRSRTLKFAGDKFDSAIVSYLRTKRDLYIGEGSAEMIKVRVGSVSEGVARGEVEVSGHNEKRKCAQTIRVGTSDVYLAIHSAMEAICRAIVSVLESTPPEIASDISDYGLLLVGGGANIHGLPELIKKKTGLRVTVAKNPMDCECVGLGKIIEHPEIIPESVLYKNR